MGKSGVLEHKSDNISETRNVKIEEKSLWRAYRKSCTNALLNGTIPDSLQPPSQDWGFATPLQNVLQSLLSQERLKLRTANLADTFIGSIRTQIHKKFWEKECGRIQGRPNFCEYPLLSQERVKLRTSNLADIFRGCMRTKAY